MSCHCCWPEDHDRNWNKSCLCRAIEYNLVLVKHLFIVWGIITISSVLAEYPLIASMALLLQCMACRQQHIVTWALVRNADSQDAPQTSWIRICILRDPNYICPLNFEKHCFTGPILRMISTRRGVCVTFVVVIYGREFSLLPCWKLQPKAGRWLQALRLQGRKFKKKK